MSGSTVLRLVMGSTLISAGLAKGLSGAAPFVSESLDLFGLSELRWTQVERAWLAISVFEVALGLALVCCAKTKHWNVALCAAVVAFIAWDFLRWTAGHAPDCGCFGKFRIASEWWHVWTKHLLLWSATLTLLLSSRRASAKPPLGVGIRI